MNKQEFFAGYPKSTFRLGLTMAGAVSAGAYTAGVMTYLLQTLDRWQESKDINLEALWLAAVKELQEEGKDVSSVNAEEIWHRGLNSKYLEGYDESVPMHEVILEVIGGASAGSIVGAMSILSLAHEIKTESDVRYIDFNKFHPEDTDLKAFEQNYPKEYELLNSHVLFDSWINMSCNNDEPLNELLNPENSSENPLMSLLNSSLVDKIAKQLFDKLFGNVEDESNDNQTQDTSPPPEFKKRTIPRYVSNSLKMIMSLTSLRAVPVGLNFSRKNSDQDEKTSKPAHYMNLHANLATFIMGDSNEGHAFKLDPYDDDKSHFLIDAAIASGAFPLGLAPRDLTFPSSYIESSIQQLFDGVDDNQIEIELGTKPTFNFLAVDGGTLNNEPFTEVNHEIDLRCTKYDKKLLQQNPKRREFNQKAMILIDPFPNFEKKKKYESPTSLSGIAKVLFDAIRGQAMVKDSEKTKGMSEGKYHIGMIFPSRRDAFGEKHPIALACGALGGFGGFLKKQFRIHDYHLGAKNCQSFIRQYFVIPEDRAEKLYSFDKWESDDLRRHKYVTEEDGVHFYPIIPDMTVDIEWRNTKEEKINFNKMLPLTFPQMKCDDLDVFRINIKRRVKYLIKNVLLGKKSYKKTGILGTILWTSQNRFFRPNALMVLIIILFLVFIALLALQLKYYALFIVFFGALLLYVIFDWAVERLCHSLMKVIIESLNDRGQIEKSKKDENVEEKDVICSS